MEVYREAEWQINLHGGVEQVPLPFLGSISMLQGAILHEADNSANIQMATWNMLQRIQEIKELDPPKPTPVVKVVKDH